MFCVPALAVDKVYTVLVVGYSDVEDSQQDTDGVAYKLGLGYQFDPQWYVEFGYQQLINDKLLIDSLPSALQVEQASHRLQGGALFLSFLGKAANNVGELFYRLGLLKTDFKGQTIHSGTHTCDFGEASVVSIDSFGSATICQYDNDGAAAVIGLGFDYFVSARAMVRTEVEYIKGQDNLAMSVFSVGLRYNF